MAIICADEFQQHDQRGFVPHIHFAGSGLQPLCDDLSERGGGQNAQTITTLGKLQMDFSQRGKI